MLRNYAACLKGGFGTPEDHVMPKQTKHSKNWGGARPGAGRPRTPSTYSAQINVRCTPELVEASLS